MEDGQVDELRRWAQGLSTDSRPEVKAAARAILMLADDLDAARSQLLEERMIREALEAGPSGEVQDADLAARQVDRDLSARLRAYLSPRFSRR